MISLFIITNLISFFVLSFNVIEINIFKKKKCNVFMIRVVFNKYFDHGVLYYRPLHRDNWGLIF